MKNKTLLILGSSRGDGETRMIVDYLLENTESDLMNLIDYEFSYYDYKHKNVDDDFMNLAKRLLDYENIVFCTPVYWYSMSGLMKTFLDRFSDLVTIEKPIGRALAGKKVWAVCCSSDATEYDWFFKPFEHTAEYLDMIYKEDIHTWIENESIPEQVKTRLLQFAKNIEK